MSTSPFASGSTHRSASGSDAIAVVETFLDALKAFDLERVEALLTEDAVYQNVPFPADRGRKATMRTIRLLARTLTFLDVRMHHIAERDGFVLTERTDVLRGPLVDMEIWVCGTFEVRDGKIALWRDRFDLATATAQLLTGPLRRLFRR